MDEKDILQKMQHHYEKHIQYSVYNVNVLYFQWPISIKQTHKKVLVKIGFTKNHLVRGKTILVFREHLVV